MKQIDFGNCLSYFSGITDTLHSSRPSEW